MLPADNGNPVGVVGVHRSSGLLGKLGAGIIVDAHQTLLQNHAPFRFDVLRCQPQARHPVRFQLEDEVETVGGEGCRVSRVVL